MSQKLHDIIKYLSTESLTLGYYNPGEIPVICHSNKEDIVTTSSMTASHEKNHEELFLNSTYGGFCILLKKTMDILRIKDKINENKINMITGIINKLMRESYLPFEACATFHELSSSVNYHAFKSRLDDLWFPYYYSLNMLYDIISQLLDLFSYKFNHCCHKLSFSLLQTINALCAAVLNIDLYCKFPDFDSLKIEKGDHFYKILSSPEFNPNKRFQILSEHSSEHKRFLKPLVDELSANETFEKDINFEIERPNQNFENIMNELDELSVSFYKITSRWLSQLDLFPVDCRIWEEPLEISNLKINFIKSAFKSFDLRVDEVFLEPLVPKERQIFSFGREQHSFKTHTYRDFYGAEKPAQINQFYAWIKESLHLPIKNNNYCFSISLYPSEIDQEIVKKRYSIQVGALSYKLRIKNQPAELNFLHRSIYLDDMTLEQLLEICKIINQVPTSIVFLYQFWNCMHMNTQNKFLSEVEIPIYLHSKLTDISIVKIFLDRFKGNVCAKMFSITGSIENILLLTSNSMGKEINLLLFITQATNNIFNKFFEVNNIKLFNEEFTLEKKTDLNMFIAFWECTRGAIGDLDI